MKDQTFITVLLDRSGSMESIKGDTIGGYNNFIDDQKKVGDNALLTLVQFDSNSTDTVQERTPIKDVPRLTNETFVPRGGTPLLDALGATIVSVGKQLAAIPEANRPDKVLFVVITDGFENASHVYTQPQVKEMINLQQGTYKWNFIFIGANIDSLATSGSLGMMKGQAANFAANSVGVASAYSSLSSNVASYRRSRRTADLEFTNVQRSAMMADEDENKWGNVSATSTVDPNGFVPPTSGTNGK